MDVCGAWPLNCFGCKHELFSETHRDRNGSFYQWACSLRHCSILFSCILERKMGLVWFPYFGGGRKPHGQSGYCVAGFGAPYVLLLDLPCSPGSRASIVLLLQAITQSHRGSENEGEVSHKSRAMEAGLELRTNGCHPELFCLCCREK